MTSALVAMGVKPSGFAWNRFGKAVAFCACYTIVGSGCSALMLHVSDTLGMLEHAYRLPFWQRPYVYAAVFCCLVVGAIFGKAIVGASGRSNYGLAIAAGMTNSLLFTWLVAPDYAIFGPIFAILDWWLFIPLCLLCHFLMKLVANRWLYRPSLEANLDPGGSCA